jgi:Na+-transporting NADH:ubiquinone oxidoreductase subunit NqrE
MNIDINTSPYLIRTLTNKINLLLLNYLYSKPSLNVTIDINNCNIIIKMETLETFNEVLEEIKKYYIDLEYYIEKPIIPIIPEFVTDIL